MAAAIGLLAAAPGALLSTYLSGALFGSTYIMLTGIILIWSVSVFHERPSAGIGGAFLPSAVGQIFGGPLRGAGGGSGTRPQENQSTPGHDARKKRRPNLASGRNLPRGG